MTKLKPIETATNRDIKIELREVYVVHGANKAYLSEKGALNKLAYVRAQEQFNQEGKQTNHTKVINHEDGSTIYHVGEMIPEFIERHAQVLEELHTSVKREKELIRTRKEYIKAIEKHRKDQEELILLGRKISQLLQK
ncbi:conserved protein of unknown function [Xenorhabdus poinarii G6]|uniref:Uncharacterized protein n=1 Tax=Xenorhabdus poinarii G6 TaxID=1354304 RepID=A0A068R025_9GAMM|nr:hypothetical protein [Xenorhabdus poinarii]CDG20553.1 conserved protein of unknown function [Xenorhabdus poinarii G6]